MKQRKFKFSLGMKIASILSCIALVSVGFASWWIVQYPTKAVTAQGSFEVYTVGTKKVVVSTPTFTTGKDTIIFGKQSTTEDGKAVDVKWLIAGTDVKEQNLQAVFTFDVSMMDVTEEENGNTSESVSSEVLNNYLSSITLKMTENGTAGAIANAISKNYITNPTISYSYIKKDATGDALQTGTATWENGEISLDINTAKAAYSQITVTVTVDFKWGTAFDSKNPYVYYNGMDYSVSNAGAAETALEGLLGLSNVTYKVDVTANPGKSAS